MKVGAERKKVIVLIVLLVVAAGLVYQQYMSAPSAPSAAPPARSPNPSTPAGQLRSAADEILGEGRAAPKSRAASRVNNTFKPSLKKRKAGEGPPLDQIDPTLRTDLLAKVQAVEYQGAERNLFQFGAAKPKLTPQQIETAKKEAEEAQKKIAEAPKAPPPEPPKPTAPPVNFKYFGYVHQPGEARKRALLQDGEDILVAAEGEVIKKRYKVVRIGVNSLVVEDLDFKSQQTLPLQETG